MWKSGTKRIGINYFTQTCFLLVVVVTTFSPLYLPLSVMIGRWIAKFSTSQKVINCKWIPNYIYDDVNISKENYASLI